VIQILLEHDGAILFARVEWLQHLDALDHAQGHGGGRPQAIQRASNPGDRRRISMKSDRSSGATDGPRVLVEMNY